jgi:hypothetical protein
MDRSRRIMKWLGIGAACAMALFLLLVAAAMRFGDYMAEGGLQSNTQRGSVLVALSDSPRVIEALQSACRQANPLPPAVAALLVSVQLVEIPSGTKVHVEMQTGGLGVSSMTVDEGRLKGREVWACSGQYYQLHAWP